MAVAPALILLLWLCTACSSATAAGPSPSTGAQTQPSSATQLPSAGTTSATPLSTTAVSGPVSTGDAAAPSTNVSAEPSAVSAPSPIRQGSQAATSRVRFVPRQVELPSGSSADVEPEPTVDGVLQIPTDVQHVGWWDGSAAAGDPFGATVIAGHVDSREQGLGIFAELLLVQVGDLITVRSDAAALTYRVVSTSLVDKQALASESQALDQRGPHRLVLITCSGQWHPEIRSYDSNFVVIADPVAD